METKKILCPICKAELNIKIDKNYNVNFDMRKATFKSWCGNCKRNIKYSIENNCVSEEKCQ